VEKLADVAVLQRQQVDLDGDGTVEQVTAYRLGAAVGLLIASEGEKMQPWRIDFPDHMVFRKMHTQDMNADGRSEVLFECDGPTTDTVSLAVIHWTGERGEILTPEGGPLEGGDLFQSRYYPPLVDDLLGDTTFEIVISVDGSNPAFLDSIVYEWDGKTYRKTDLYLMPPRAVPTQVQQ
jgi:hypothetical protein